MCVQNIEDDKSTYRCGMCEECSQEYNDKINNEKANNTSCGNCGWCEECF